MILGAGEGVSAPGELPGVIYKNHRMPSLTTAHVKRYTPSLAFLLLAYVTLLALRATMIEVCHRQFRACSPPPCM